MEQSKVLTKQEQAIKEAKIKALEEAYAPPLAEKNFELSIREDGSILVKSKPITHEVVKAAMDAVVKDVRKPKVVRDGIVKEKTK